MPAEQRTRVEVFLPVRTEMPAYQAVTDWLAEELAFARGGATPVSVLIERAGLFKKLLRGIRLFAARKELPKTRFWLG